MENHTNLIQWLVTKSDDDFSVSTIAECLKIKDDPLFGRCICIQDDIENGTSIIKIPKKFLLNYVTVLKHLSYFNVGIEKFIQKNVQNFNKEFYATKSDCYTSIYSSFDHEKLLKLTSHQLLTLYIVLESKRKLESFWFPLLSCFPKLQEYEGIPMTWILKDSTQSSSDIFNTLPRSTIEHSQSQISQFNKDIEIINNILTEGDVKITREEYLWSWLAINTRCLYFKLPYYLPITETKHKEESNITMVPFIDFVNHDSNLSNAVAQEIKSGYEVHTTTTISRGDSLWFTYGPHSDEFLQCEYGFSESKCNANDNETYYRINSYNVIDISHILLKLLSSSKKQNVREWLKQTSYYDDYTLGIEENNFDELSGLVSIKVNPSFRTRIALASLFENDMDFKFNENQGNIQCPMKLQKFYEGYNDGEYYQKAEAIFLNKIIIKLKDEIKTKLEKLDALADVRPNESSICKKLLMNQLFLLNSA